MIITSNVRWCLVNCAALLFLSALHSIDAHTIDLQAAEYLREAHHDAVIHFDWAVVGGGPGGIITVGVLLDAGVHPAKILWIDREFLVGRMGQYYSTVPANNKAKRLVEFIHMCAAFEKVQTPAMKLLMNAHPGKEYLLKMIIDPLQDITDSFLKDVCSARGLLTQLDFANDSWNLVVNETNYRAHRVVLATGSHPKPLNYNSCTEIGLDKALNKSELIKCLAPDDTVAVIGGAHSAVLVMKFLCEVKVARVINFYKYPLHYLTPEQQALRIKTCQLHGDPLSGMAAEWAREVLDVNPPSNLLRVKVCEESLKAWLPVCTKIIYAAGYEPNALPPVTGIALAHDSATGVIGPHLFGIGIAFPEFIDDGKGHCSYRVGLREFMRFAQRVVPEWMHKNALDAYSRYEDLIVFNQL